MNSDSVVILGSEGFVPENIDSQDNASDADRGNGNIEDAEDNDIGEAADTNDG